MIRTTMLAAATMVALSTPAIAQDMNVVETAEANGSFTTLLATAEGAGLVETLRGEGPFTIFAPTDEAFAALPEGAVDELLREENKDRLVRLLMYHVVPGRIMSSDLSDGMEAITAADRSLPVSLAGEEIMVGDATVVEPGHRGVKRRHSRDRRGSDAGDVNPRREAPPNAVQPADHAVLLRACRIRPLAKRSGMTSERGRRGTGGCAHRLVSREMRRNRPKWQRCAEEEAPCPFVPRPAPT